MGRDLSSWPDPSRSRTKQPTRLLKNTSVLSSKGSSARCFLHLARMVATGTERMGSLVQVAMMKLGRTMRPVVFYTPFPSRHPRLIRASMTPVGQVGLRPRVLTPPRAHDGVCNVLWLLWRSCACNLSSSPTDSRSWPIWPECPTNHAP